MRAVFLTLSAVAASWAPPGLERHFACPFAKVWLEHGPEAASDLLGVERPAAGDPAPERCAIAPGLPGGAHQNSLSPGYSTNCSGAPGEASPYMWPMAFAYHGVETTLPFDTNTPTLVKKTEKWYNFNKMMKRSDSVESTPKAENDLTTVLHRNNNMWIIYWRDGADFANVSQIKYCMQIDMGVVGLMRPDFFLDSRPYFAKDIQTQYLGNQHVYHEGSPRLVKQWRKKDHVNTTFTMSMDEHTGEDGIHWPMMLDVPGERSGPDMLQMMHDHRVITDADDHVFFLDQGFLAGGGVCVNPFNQTQYKCTVCLHTYDALSDGDGSAFEDLPDDWLCPVCGAPKSAYKQGNGEMTGAPSPVPSALELDVNAWREIEYTFSPIWDPPAPTPPGPAPVIAEYVCDVCKHVYDPEQDGSGSAFEDLPDEWVCPVCAAPKSAYHKMDSPALGEALV